MTPKKDNFGFYLKKMKCGYRFATTEGERYLQPVEPITDATDYEWVLVTSKIVKDFMEINRYHNEHYPKQTIKAMFDPEHLDFNKKVRTSYEKRVRKFANKWGWDNWLTMFGQSMVAHRDGSYAGFITYPTALNIYNQVDQVISASVSLKNQTGLYDVYSNINSFTDGFNVQLKVEDGTPIIRAENLLNSVWYFLLLDAKQYGFKVCAYKHCNHPFIAYRKDKDCCSASCKERKNKRKRK